MTVRGAPAPNTPAGVTAWRERFQTLAEHLVKREEGKPAMRRTYALAGRRLELTSRSEEALARLALPLEHLRREPGGPPSLVAWLTEGALPEDSGLGALEAAGEHASANGSVRSRLLLGDGSEVLGAFWPASRMLGLFERASGRALLWVMEAGHLGPAEAATLTRAVAAWWLGDADTAVVHAAALAGPRGAALLVGPGGAGKSSAALAGVAAGLTLLGDDSVLCCASRTEVFSLSCCASVYADDLKAHYAGLTSLVAGAPGPDGKVVLSLVSLEPRRVAPSAPLCAVIRLDFSDDPQGRLEPASQASVLRALAPSSIFNVPASPHATFATISQLVRRLPAYRLQLPSDRCQTARLLADFLTRGKHG